jgi:hypothetical protein
MPREVWHNAANRGNPQQVWLLLARCGVGAVSAELSKRLHRAFF